MGIEAIQSYYRWFNHVTQFLAVGQGEDIPQDPVGVAVLVAGMKDSVAFDRDTATQLIKQHSDLMQTSSNLVAQTLSDKQSAAADAILSLTTLYNAFMASFVPFAYALEAARQGMDVKTGLRSGDALLDFLDSEMDFLSRGGPVFVLARMQIVGWDALPRLRADLQDKILIALSASLRRDLRSFDVVFRQQYGALILILRSATKGMATGILDRVQASFEKQPICKECQALGQQVRLLSCVADAVVGDDPAERLKQLDHEISLYDSDGGVIEHRDISPFQQFMEDKAQQEA